MIPVIVKLCESPGRAGGLPVINYTIHFESAVLGLFAFASGTVMLVTDPYKMADIGLIMLGLYLMLTGLRTPKAD
ncbi:hypothetical protein AADEFJLK_03339 [Methylovulum psychrotolerans]|uniref:Uncharacterized protein n=1 Tax=Methylovulum psychrotolerans TaxID=1704499 RepID=A0A2S5CJE5_9GAMM|nr:hypothetical protein AADEFJLK_03339 [Methylovulum psychrotolerans]